MTWEEAKVYCEKKGGHLATLTDTKENSAVYEYLRSLGLDTAYFGLYNPSEDNETWLWVTGEKADYSYWANGEPNGWWEKYGMYYSAYEYGEWNDGDGEANFFICEWDKEQISK